MADWEKVESPGASAEGCKASSGDLKHACDYSFADLYRAACATTSCPCDEVEVKAACESLYELKRDDLNKMVHEWAMTADWETEMQMGSDQPHGRPGAVSTGARAPCPALCSTCPGWRR